MNDTKILPLLHESDTSTSSYETTSSCEESIDFNSEGACCSVGSHHPQIAAVRILGMDLLVECTDELSDYSLESELATEEGPSRAIPTAQHKRRHRYRKQESTDSGLCGEVDSLILTKRRLPHLVNKDHSIRQLSNFYRHGKGLMGEVDSVELDRKRLAHLHHRRTQKGHESLNIQKYHDFVNAVSKSLKIAEDELSTATTESASSHRSGCFDTGAVDSKLIPT